MTYDLKKLKRSSQSNGTVVPCNLVAQDSNLGPETGFPDGAFS